MKDMFPGYYRPTEDEFRQLWNDAIFVFDANVLLDIYRFSPNTSKELVGIIEKLGDRIWLPYQFAYEYHEHLMSIHDDIPSEFGAWKDELDMLSQKVQSHLRSFQNRTQFDIDDLLDKVKSFFEELSDDLGNLSQKQVQKLIEDDLSNSIASLFDGKVGQEYSEVVLENKYQLGKHRYARNLPPGYKDKTKGEPQCYGDLIGWFQIIDYAKQKNLPIIMVSGDSRSDDWFYKVKGKIRGPRPELIKEMRDEAGVDFYLYQTSQFIRRAKDYLDSQVSDETVDEITNFEKRNLTASWQEFMNLQLANDFETFTNAINSSALVDTRAIRDLMRDSSRNEQVNQAMRDLMRDSSRNEQVNQAMRDLMRDSSRNEQVNQAMRDLMRDSSRNEQVNQAMDSPYLFQNKMSSGTRSQSSKDEQYDPDETE